MRTESLNLVVVLDSQGLCSVKSVNCKQVYIASQCMPYLLKVYVWSLYKEINIKIITVLLWQGLYLCCVPEQAQQLSLKYYHLGYMYPLGIWALFPLHFNLPYFREESWTSDFKAGLTASENISQRTTELLRLEIWAFVFKNWSSVLLKSVDCSHKILSVPCT